MHYFLTTFSNGQLVNGSEVRIYNFDTDIAETYAYNLATNQLESTKNNTPAKTYEYEKLYETDLDFWLRTHKQLKQMLNC